jgi:hypothetical protein
VCTGFYINAVTQGDDPRIATPAQIPHTTFAQGQIRPIDRKRFELFSPPNATVSTLFHAQAISALCVGVISAAIAYYEALSAVFGAPRRAMMRTMSTL